MVWRRRRDMRVWVTGLALGIGLWQGSADASGRLRVEWTGQYLSIVADAVPLEHIVREVARQAGLEISGVESVPEPVSIRFSQLPLRAGLERILARVGRLLVEEPVPGGGSRVTRVLLFGSGAGGHRAPQVTEPAPGEPRGEAVVTPDVPWPDTLAADPEDDEFSREVLRNPGGIVAVTTPGSPMQWDERHTVLAPDGDATGERSMQRLHAVLLLGDAPDDGTETALTTLHGALGDGDAAVRTNAVHALAARGGSIAWDALRQGLHDPDPAVRLAVVENAAQSQEGRALLDEARLDPDEAVRALAEFWATQGDGDSR